MTWVCGRPVEINWCSADLKDYETAVATFIERCRGGTVYGIYQIGHVNVPGVSDVDFVLVFNSLPESVIKYTITSLHEFERPFIIHDPIFITKDLLEGFSRLYPIFQVVPLWEQEQASLKLSQVRTSASWKLSQALQWLFTKVPGSLFKRCVEALVINARSLLNNVYSFRHTLALCDGVVKLECNNWQQDFDQLNQFRRLALTLPRPEFLTELEAWCDRVLRLIYQAIGNLMSVWSDFDDGQFDQYQSGDYLHYDPNGLNLLFLRDWSTAKALCLTYFFQTNGFQIPTILPLCFSNYLCRVASVRNSEISQTVEKLLIRGGVKLDRYDAPVDPFQDTVEQYIRLCESYFKLNRVLQYPGMPFLQFGLSAINEPIGQCAIGGVKKLIRRRLGGPKPVSRSSIEQGLHLMGSSTLSSPYRAS